MDKECASIGWEGTEEQPGMRCLGAGNSWGSSPLATEPLTAKGEAPGLPLGLHLSEKELCALCTTGQSHHTKEWPSATLENSQQHRAERPLPPDPQLCRITGHAVSLLFLYAEREDRKVSGSWLITSYLSFNFQGFFTLGILLTLAILHILKRERQTSEKPHIRLQ